MRLDADEIMHLHQLQAFAFRRSSERSMGFTPASLPLVQIYVPRKSESSKRRFSIRLPTTFSAPIHRR
jgi:hypothetical protein